MNNSLNSKAYFPALTGIRAVAAYMVFLQHYFNHGTSFIQSIPLVILNFFTEFHIGVTIFFMLSGFLIGYRYKNSITYNWSQYLLNRFARIYPVFFLLTTITFLYYTFFPYDQFDSSLKVYLMNITFVKPLFDEFKFTGIAQSWSLTVEEMFYLCAPVMILLLKRTWRMIIIIPVILCLIGIIIYYLNITFGSYQLLGDLDLIFSYTFFGRAFEFTLGVFIAIYLEKITVKKVNLTYIGIFGILLSTYALMTVTSYYQIISVRHTYGQLISNIILPIVGIGPLLIGLITEQTIISKILSSKLFSILGKSSYVFYLIHMGVIYALIDSLTNSMIITFLTLIILSIIIFRFIEEPLNKFFRQLPEKLIELRCVGKPLRTKIKLLRLNSKVDQI